MEKVFDPLLKLIPFAKYFEKLGLSTEISAALATIVNALLIYLIVFLIKRIYKKYKISKLAVNELNPQFDFISIRKAKKYYIQTQYQNASPSRQDEPGFTHKYIARNKLITFFIKKVFTEKKRDDRFYLILADSGMGKTTFLINLYLKYHSFFSNSISTKMKLFRFSNSETIQEIKLISKHEAKNTILLIDSLDEDLGIIPKTSDISEEVAFKNRVDEIIDLTQNFYQVIITCRTQYFPGQEDDPYELKIKRPDEKGYYILNKLYISPFDEKEVNIYLRKKFGYLPFINFKKKKKANEIIVKSQHLVMRPMLLSYIDYLVEDNKTYVTTFEIYETLVQKWFIREAEKRKKIRDRSQFIEKLNRLSGQIAVEIYRNWKDNNGLFLNKEQTLEIAYKNQIDLRPEEITGQSLLTCDGLGNWKFAHKSILEFFLAKEAFNNQKFLREINYFLGMDMAENFYNELHPNFVLIKGGNLESLNTKNNVKSKASEVNVPDFYISRTYITKEEYNKVTTGFPTPDKIKHDIDIDNDIYMTEISWFEAARFCNALNMQKGYHPVYDKEYNLIDENGNIVTDDLYNIRGYRLPTDKEWQFALDNPFNLKKEKRHKIIRLSKSGSDFYFTLIGMMYQSHIFEWCYDAFESDNGKAASQLTSDRIVRGSFSGSVSLNSNPEFSRNRYNPNNKLSNIAFRVIFFP